MKKFKISIQVFKGRLHFSLILSLVCLLFTFMLWNYYFNSNEPLDRTVTANLIFIMGSFFSIAAGLFACSLETRRDSLEKEVAHKTQELLQKNSETKRAEIAASAIYQSCHILFSEVGLSGLLERVMDLMSKVLRADEGSLMLLDPDCGELYIAASRGIPREIASTTRIRLGERVAGRAAKLRKEFLLVDGIENYPEFRDVEADPNIRSSIVCPMICQNELIGVLNLNRTQDKENFTVSDMINVSIFAAQVAQAVRNALLYQALEKKLAELEERSRTIKVLQGEP